MTVSKISTIVGLPGSAKMGVKVDEACEGNDVKGLIFTTRKLLALAEKCEGALKYLLEPILRQLFDKLPSALRPLFKKQTAYWDRDHEALRVTVSEHEVCKAMRLSDSSDLEPLLQTWQDSLQRALDNLKGTHPWAVFEVLVSPDGTRGCEISLHVAKNNFNFLL